MTQAALSAAKETLAGDPRENKRSSNGAKQINRRSSKLSQPRGRRGTGKPTRDQEEPSNYDGKEILSRNVDTLSNRHKISKPKDIDKGQKSSTYAGIGQDVDQNNGPSDDLDDLDTEDLAELAQECKSRDAAEQELEQAVLALVKRRQNTTKHSVARPWERLQQLAATALAAKRDLASITVQAREAREEMVICKASADRWQAEAEALRRQVTLSGATKDSANGSALEDVRSRLAEQSIESDELRSQRDRISCDLEICRSENNNLRSQLDSIQQERDQALRELERVKRIAQSSISNLETQNRSYKQEWETLRMSEQKLKLQYIQSCEDLESMRAENTTFEADIDALRQDLKNTETAFEAERVESAKRQALLEQEQLRTRQIRLEVEHLTKQYDDTKKALDVTRQELARQDQARVSAYTEHEEAQESMRTEVEAAREREGALRETIAGLRAEVQATRNDAMQAEKDAQARVQDLEQTISKLLQNMQSRALELASTRPSPTIVRKALDMSVEEQDAITERANKIRQEIHLATKHLYQSRERSTSRDEDENGGLSKDEPNQKPEWRKLAKGKSHQEQAVHGDSEEMTNDKEESEKRARARTRPRRRGSSRATGSPYKL